MTCFKNVVFCIILLLSQLTLIYAQDTVYLNNKRKVVNLVPHLSYLLDNTKKLEIRDVRTDAWQQRFIKNTSPNLNLGTGGKVVWVKFNLKVAEPGKYLVEFRNTGIENVALYYKKAKSQDYILSGRTGDNMLFSQRKFRTTNYLFEMELASQQDYIVYLRCYSNELLTLPVYAGSYHAFLEKNQAEDLVLGGFYGILLIMIFYNLFIFFSTRDKSYLYYVLYVFVSLLASSSLKGHSLQFLWFNQTWLNDLISVYIAGIGIFILLFADHFLGVKKLFPFFAKLSFVFRCLLVGIIFVDFFDKGLPVTLTQIFVPLAIVYSLIIGVFTLKKGYKPARYYLLGWLLLLVTATLLALSNAGLLPYNSFASYYVAEVGITCEVALFSLALADKINYYRAENGRIIKEQNEHLEQEVKSRTREILEQKEELSLQTEQLKNANQQLNQLGEFKHEMTNMIIHDLKNPLAGIMGMVNSSGEGRMDKVKMSSSVQQMLYMIQNILDVQKAEEAEVDFVITEVVMGQVINEVIVQQRVLASTKNINLRYNMLSGDTVKADQQVLVRILSNLVSNAIKFTPENGEIRLYSYYTENDTMLKVEVHDTGIGIEASQLDKVFDKFHSIDKASQTGVRSTGLGLTFCKLAIEAQNGTIGVTSTQNKGSVFWFTLPLVAKAKNLKTDKNSGAKKLRNNVILEEIEVVKARLLGQDKALVKAVIRQIRKQNVNHSYPIRLVRIFNVVKAKIEVSPEVEEWMLMMQKDATNSVIFEALLNLDDNL